MNFDPDPTPIPGSVEAIIIFINRILLFVVYHVPHPTIWDDSFWSNILIGDHVI